MGPALLPLNFAGANLLENRALKRKLEHEMDDREKWEYGEDVFDGGPDDVVEEFALGVLGTEVGKIVDDFYASGAFTDEPEASTRAHTHSVCSARPSCTCACTTEEHAR